MPSLHVLSTVNHCFSTLQYMYIALVYTVRIHMHVYTCTYISEYITSQWVEDMYMYIVYTCIVFLSYCDSVISCCTCTCTCKFACMYCTCTCKGRHTQSDDSLSLPSISPPPPLLLAVKMWFTTTRTRSLRSERPPPTTRGVPAVL